MRNEYELIPTKTIVAPNGTRILIFTDGQHTLISASRLAQAMGYVGFNYQSHNLLSATFKNHNFAIYRKQTSSSNQPFYVCDAREVIPILQAFIKLTLLTTTANNGQKLKADNARMEAERLIEVFNRELFGKADTCTVTRIEQNSQDTSEEVTQMEPIKMIQTNVPPLTTHDIEEIGERAEATVKVFGASKTDALRAVTQLKAQEIKRDLSPLLELLR